MKSALIALIVAVVGISVTMNDADAARRLGGGSNSGMQRMQPTKRDAAPSQNAAPQRQTPPASQPAGASRWFGPLAGLAAGIGLVALFSHLGLSEELASFAMMALIAAAAFFLIRFLLRRLQPQTQPLRYAGATGIEPTIDEVPVRGGGTGAAVVSRDAHIEGPAGFDPESFVHHAKVNFLRLQAANDAGNLDDLREFTTPEMFAEIQLRLQARGSAPQKTDVVTLNAELLEVITEFRQHIASVRFHGMIRETADGAAEPFDEIWHISMPVDESRNWAIAGIQQTA
jgi:predicted lipid-binding transport protein (Tim44 family)